MRLGRLVDDLLLVAQVDAGRFTIAPGAADLPRAGARLRPAPAALADERRIELRASTAPVEPIEGDSIRLAQLLDNLVSNAIKFTPSGGRVEVRVTADDELAVIEVADTGMGIPEAEQGPCSSASRGRRPPPSAASRAPASASCWPGPWPRPTAAA